MIRYVFTSLLLIISFAAMCQPKAKTSKVNLISSERSHGDKVNGNDVIKVYKGTFQQDYSILKSDSAYFYPQRNAFDAFGHVNINQGDTLNIYSDKLNYEGNTHVALMTDNVRMVDKDATLTTNYLTYNTATRVGTYTGGGKLVNKENTLTSTNGYYYAFTRDAYFRYNVVLTTVDATIRTDTLRYNSGSRIAYFYGPSHIYGKKNNDTLYTENGLYKTIPEQAFFGKKNLYTQNTKSLKGDSLFYDRLKGYGRAVKNVVFNDTEQKITMHGQLGIYFQADQNTIVTINPWVTIVTEEKDTTSTDSAAKPIPAVKGDKNKSVSKAAPNTQPLKTALADIKKAGDKATPNMANEAAKAVANTDSTKLKTAATINNLSKANLTKDSTKAAVKQVNAAVGSMVKSPLNKDSLTTAKLIDAKKKKAVKGQQDVSKTIAVKDTTTRMKRDTIYMVADTLETRILTFKALKMMQEERRLASIIDTSAAGRAKRAARNVKPSKFLNIEAPKLATDTAYRHRDFFGPPKKEPVRVANNAKQNKGKPGAPAKKLTAADSLKIKSDSVYMKSKFVLSDTARIRILIGHHNAKIFKSDLQAKADSIFYSSSDSTIRCFVKPMIWSQGSQMSGDTIYLQMKNKKLDNMDVFYNSFVVNVEDNDTTHFNQVAGKKMRAFFVNSKLNRMFVDGNAERIYFSRDSLKQVDGMYRSLASRIRANFKDNKIANVLDVVKNEYRYGPPNQFKEEEKILKGFIWNPKDRPVSKEAIIPELDKTGKYKRAPVKKPPVKNGIPGKGLPGLKTGKDSLINNLLNMPGVKGVKDSLLKNKAMKTPGGIKGVKDTLMNKAMKTPGGIKGAQDSINNVLKRPGVKAIKDSLINKALKQPGAGAVKDSLLKKVPTKRDTVKQRN